MSKTDERDHSRDHRFSSISHIGYSAQVPGNVSRYFTSREEARSQPLGEIVLAWDEASPLIFNDAFDPAIVRHDDNYWTTSVLLGGTQSLPTTEYFDSEVAPYLAADSSVIDIGCGQGEFVNWLCFRGVSATGYDPVLKRQTANLIKRYWTPAEAPADLYVLRCVLPHIRNPWDFLNAIADGNSKAMVLIEYQRLEFILNQRLWFQISHDHVNQFRMSDFRERYDVMAHGVFAQDEWEWVLFRPATFRSPASKRFDLSRSLLDLETARLRTVERLADLDRPIALWGAAGKGVVLSHTLAAAGVKGLLMIDADPMKSGLYIEGSGAQVIHPSTAFGLLPLETEVVVVNPNHVDDVRRLVGTRFRVSLAGDWSVP